jgi:streptogramin lyase
MSGIHATAPNSLSPSIVAFNPSSTSPYVSTFPISQNSSDFIPFVLDPASNKTVWVVTIKQGFIVNNVVQPPQAHIVNYTLGVGARPVITLIGAIPSDIVYDQNRKRVWFLENDSLAYYNQTAPKGNVTIEQTFPGGSPQFMTIDSSGTIWLTLLGTNQIAEYDPSTKQLPNLFDAPTPNSSLQGITVAPDGTIWFAETAVKRIGHLIPCQSASCTITDYGPPTGIEITFPIQIAIDPSGTVWFTDHGSGQFGSFNPSTYEWKVFPIGYCSAPFPDCAVGLPNAISADSHGEIWFSEHYAGRVARYDPSTGTLTEYTVPANTPPYVWWMSPGPGNLVWFTAFGIGRIGYVNASIPIPITVNAEATTFRIEQGTSQIIPASVSNHAESLVYLNVSANGHDAPFGSTPLLYGFADPNNISPATNPVTATFRVFASFSADPGERLVALTAYNNNIAVSAFVTVDITPTTIPFILRTNAPYYSVGFVSTIGAGVIGLFLLRVPKKLVERS